MTRAFWIGGETYAPIYTTGQTGFLVKHSNAVRGWTRYELRDEPAQTNQSFQPRLYGWCGTDNDTATHGCGIARVERVARNGRAYVRVLDGNAALAVLVDLGYPELCDEVPGLVVLAQASGQVLTTVGDLELDQNGDPQIGVAIDGRSVGVFAWQQQYNSQGDLTYALSTDPGGGDALDVLRQLDLSRDELDHSDAFRDLDAQAVALGDAQIQTC